jgi:ABC-type cobalamin/Fe3+-siderophores transport system ATPase subunit
MEQTVPTIGQDASARPDEGNSVAVDLIGMHKWYGEFHVLRDINLRVMRGERIVICGPSGSGKSTMIRCINRLEEHQQGRIIVDGIELTNDLKKGAGRGSSARLRGSGSGPAASRAATYCLPEASRAPIALN